MGGGPTETKKLRRGLTVLGTCLFIGDGMWAHVWDPNVTADHGPESRTGNLKRVGEVSSRNRRHFCASTY